MLRPEVRSRKESLLAGEAAEACALEFSVRELCFLAGCAAFSDRAGSILTVRHARALDADERGSLRLIGGDHVRLMRV
jgi:hypothetical protein